MSQFDDDLARLEHEVANLKRNHKFLKDSMEDERRRKRERDQAFAEEIRILQSFKEDRGINWALTSIMGGEADFRCRHCDRLLVGLELHSKLCRFCQSDENELLIPPKERNF